MDSIGIAALTLALAAGASSALLSRRGRWWLAVSLLVLSAGILRANLAGHWWLSDWDERYHAVVARNLIDHPLQPSLVEHALTDVPPRDWARTHIWLHKPPLALWMMAGSMRLFGENELALRLPSVLLASLGVLVTFLIARRFLTFPASLAAAAFHAWHGRSALLAAGLRATDHVDTVLIFLVGLGALLSVLAADALSPAPSSRSDPSEPDASTQRLRRNGFVYTILTGVVLGLGFLAKSAPALVILVVLFLRSWQRGASWPLRIGAPALVLAVGVVVALPWTLYVASAYPEAWAYEGERNLRNFFTAVEGHTGSWTFHLRDLPRRFGPLAWLPLLFFLWETVRRRRDWIPLAGWLLLTYGVFSLAATKMVSYVLIASPVVWCALGWFCVESWRRTGEGPLRRRAMAAVAVLAVAGGFFFASSLSAQRYAKAALRRATWAEELRYLGDRVRALPAGHWVVFGATAPTEALFYARAGFEPGMPDSDALARAAERGMRVAVYGAVADAVSKSLSAEPRITVIPIDPRTRDERRILAFLRTLEASDPLVLNARDAADLEEYLEHFIEVDVRGRLPDPGTRQARRIEAARERGRAVIILYPPGELDPTLRERFPAAVFLADADRAF